MSSEHRPITPADRRNGMPIITHSVLVGGVLVEAYALERTSIIVRVNGEHGMINADLAGAEAVGRVIAAAVEDSQSMVGGA